MVVSSTKGCRVNKIELKTARLFHVVLSSDISEQILYDICNSILYDLSFRSLT